MLEDVLSALAATGELASMLVVTVDRGAAGVAARHGAQVTHEQADDGHTAAVAAAAARLAALGCDMLTVPADIPLLQSADIERLLAVRGEILERGARGFIIVPARDECGSNAVICSPADAVPLRFGDNSFLPHLAQAKACGIEPVVLRLPRIALDIDAPRRRGAAARRACAHPHARAATSMARSRQRRDQRVGRAIDVSYNTRYSRSS